MNPNHMHLKTRFLSTLIRTQVAVVRFLPGVGFEVPLQVKLVTILFATNWTNVTRFSVFWGHSFVCAKGSSEVRCVKGQTRRWIARRFTTHGRRPLQKFIRIWKHCQRWPLCSLLLTTGVLQCSKFELFYFYLCTHFTNLRSQYYYYLCYLTTVVAQILLCNSEFQ